MTLRTDKLGKARFADEPAVAIITLTVLPGLSVWAGGRIQEVPVISSYPVYTSVVREEPRQTCHIEQVAIATRPQFNDAGDFRYDHRWCLG